MRLTSLFLSAAVLLKTGAAETVPFDTSKAGELPQHWTVAMTHKSGAPKWEIIKYALHPVGIL